MKKVFISTLIILLLTTACNDEFLDRTPLSEIVPENSFQTAEDLELYTNSFYNVLPGREGIIEQDLLSDNVLYNGVPQEQTGERLVPSEAGSSGWDWDDLRTINIFFKYYDQCDDEAAKTEYSGVAYFFRAYFYFDKLKRFGGVPWYDTVIGSGDDELLYAARDTREYVTERIIEDLDNAIANLRDDQTSDRVTKWTALALKSRVCLFEGTFRKYHNGTDADALLQLAADAAGTLMTEGPYSLYTTGDASVDYRDLFASAETKDEEVLLTRKYSEEVNVMNNINYYLLSPTQEDVGLTKSIVDSYLNEDGTAFTDNTDYATMEYYDEMQNRDPRLSQTIRTPGYMRIEGTSEELTDFSVAISGYQIVKYVSDESQDGDSAGYQDLPIIRYAEVLLNYAEAKAELGSLTQSDVDASINLIRSRAGMPGLSMSDANAIPDAVLAARYSNVSGSNTGVILEIRRERRIELVLEGFRYDDLMRWKNGKLLEEYFKGMYFQGYGTYDLNNDGTADVEVYTGTATGGTDQTVEIGGVLSFSNSTYGNLIPFEDRTKSFDEDRDYLYPIPSGDIQLNPNLEQNPNW
ncbi:hypothetical protein NBRC110019_20140 [Neptunitalea chrysea]|uniref:RagB/SusD family nutrient uptake outer membrane protein n=1 Tax=Neptunitalea chrysea TaxID=1647581 RepID=A0A9W6B5I0_9FLAO|nr:RagB/SusD family nutrient uptake outer membrane protein [Neptunitalea chrysea]GLB52974.1 hypothetical protein NBRC110019_20140 [Neptunitalea chrysea]